MAAFNEIQRGAPQSIQLAVTEVLDENYPGAAAYAQKNAPTAVMASDVAVLGGVGPSYMQAVEALAFSQHAFVGNSNLTNLRAFATNGGKGAEAKSTETNYGKNNSVGVFNPTFYAPSGVGARNGGSGGNSGGGYGRTAGGNVASTGVERMIELLLAQSLGQGGQSNGVLPLTSDAVTLVGRSPQSEANAFHELTGALVLLLSEQMNKAGASAAAPSSQVRQLLAELAQQQQAGSTLAQPQLQALMDELSVMQLIESTRSNSAAQASNPMVNTILQLMQNLLGAQSGGSVSASQMQSLLMTLMKNMNSGGSENSAAVEMMQELLPELMATLSAEMTPVPGSVATPSGGLLSEGIRLAPFRARIGSDGSLSANVAGATATPSVTMQASNSGVLTILDDVQGKIAGGFGIGASLGQNAQGATRLQTGTFSWNAGNDAIALTAQGEAAVTSDAGKSWSTLPREGISNYNPGNGGPVLTYNPAAKTVVFNATGSDNDTIVATMRADTDGVSFDAIEGQNGLTVSGQLAAVLG